MPWQVGGFGGGSEECSALACGSDIPWPTRWRWIRRGRGCGAQRGGQTWAMGCAATCFEPPVPSFLSGLDGTLRAGAYRVCADPAEMLAGIDEFGVRASQG